MKKLSLMAALCIAGFGYATTASENVKTLKENRGFEIKVSEQDTTKRQPDTTRTPRVPERRIPMPTDPSDPRNPIPVPTEPDMPSPRPLPSPSPVPSPNPTPTPTNPDPSLPQTPSSPSPTGPR